MLLLHAFDTFDFSFLFALILSKHIVYSFIVYLKGKKEPTSYPPKYFIICHH